MIQLDDLPHHLETINYERWDRLFSLINEIENAEVFGTMAGGNQLEDGSFTFPYWVAAEIVDKTSEELFELNILPVFDWMQWQEGKSFLDPEYEFKDPDVITLCKLLTVIYRLDRFSEGTIIHHFKSGTILKILKALQYKVAHK